MSFYPNFGGGASCLGSMEKRMYLQKRFPQLSAEAFANSRDTSFERHILLHTQGKGSCSVLQGTIDMTSDILD